MPATNKQQDPFQHNPWGFSSWSKFFKTQISHATVDLIWLRRPTREAKKMEPSWTTWSWDTECWQVEWDRKKEIGDVDFASIGAISSNTMNLWSVHCTSIYLIYTFLLIYLHDCYLMYSIINYHLPFPRELFVVFAGDKNPSILPAKMLIWVCHIRIYIPSIGLEHNFRPHTIGLWAARIRVSNPQQNANYRIVGVMGEWGICISGLQQLVLPEFCW